MEFQPAAAYLDLWKQMSLKCDCEHQAALASCTVDETGNTTTFFYFNFVPLWCTTKYTKILTYTGIILISCLK